MRPEARSDEPLAMGHKTNDNLKLKQAFTVSYADAANVAAADYIGIASGKKVADERILDAEGKVSLDLLQPIVFDSAQNLYRVVGKEVGGAWKIGDHFK